MYRWRINSSILEKEELLQNHLKISKVISRLLVLRGIDTVEKAEIFFSSNVSKLYSPFLMKDMEKAVQIILKAIANHERIRIVGDYDQDGNSATVTLMKGLSRLSADVSYAIPHRIIDGYGINTEIIETAKNDHIDLMITCDNGISAFEAADYAKKIGLKYIITDHHQVAMENGCQILPKADAILNPQQKDCKYPFKALCGAGVAFKLIQGLYERLDLGIEPIVDLLQFVAMGTVCDMVDIIDENRILVTEGLRRINCTTNYGLLSLIEESGWTKDIDVYALGFVLGPAINASGRLDSANIAAELFLEEDRDLIKSYARQLVLLNRQRQEMTQNGETSLEKQVQCWDIEKNPVVVLCAKELHESLAGIVAGKIKEKYYRPCIVLTSSKDEGIWKGSGRSIEGYSMFDKLSEQNQYLERFGGHPMAAGLTIKEEHIATLITALNENHGLTREEFIPVLNIDIPFKLKFLNEAFVQSLKVMEPFGKGNPEPVFASKKVKLKKLQRIGKKMNVLKYIFEDDGVEVEGISFQKTDEIIERLKGKRNVQYNENENNESFVNIAYTPKVNTYMGKNTVQLQIKDIY